MSERQTVKQNNKKKEKSGSRVTAALYGSSSPHLGLIWVMGSYYDLAGTNKWLNRFLGPIQPGAARSYFGSPAYFSSHSHSGEDDPFLGQISLSDVHNSACVSVTCRMKDCFVWLICLGPRQWFVCLLELSLIDQDEPSDPRESILMTALVRGYIWKSCNVSTTGGMKHTTK